MSKAGQTKKLKLTQSEDLSQKPINPNSTQSQKTEEIRSVHRNILLEVIKFRGKGNTLSEKIEKMSNKSGKAQMQQQIDYQQLPQPLDSEEEVQSRQAKYLTYLENTIPAEESQNQVSFDGCNLRERLRGSKRQEFLSILYLCALYVKKSEMRTGTDDQLLMERLVEHISTEYVSRPMSDVGNALLANGYVVAAYCIVKARLQSSYSILNYMLNYYTQNLVQFQENVQQFLYISTLDRSQLHVANISPKNKSPSPRRRMSQQNSDNSVRKTRTLNDEQWLKRTHIDQHREQFNFNKKQTQISSQNYEDCFQQANKMKATMVTSSEVKSRRKSMRKKGNKSPNL